MEEVGHLQSLPCEVISLILSYLSRKTKWQLRELCKDFKETYIPHAMVSLRFQNFLEKDFLKCSINNCLFLRKLEISKLEAPITNELLDYISELLNDPECRIFDSLKTLVLKSLHIDDFKKFAETLLCNFKSLESLYIEDVTTDNDLVQSLVSNSENYKFFDTLKELSVMS